MAWIQPAKNNTKSKSSCLTVSAWYQEETNGDIFKKSINPTFINSLTHILTSQFRWNNPNLLCAGVHLARGRGAAWPRPTAPTWAATTPPTPRTRPPSGPPGSARPRPCATPPRRGSPAGSCSCCVRGRSVWQSAFSHSDVKWSNPVILQPVSN